MVKHVINIYLKVALQTVIDDRNAVKRSLHKTH